MVDDLGEMQSTTILKPKILIKLTYLKVEFEPSCNPTTHSPSASEILLANEKEESLSLLLAN